MTNGKKINLNGKSIGIRSDQNKIITCPNGIISFEICQKIRDPAWVE